MIVQSDPAPVAVDPQRTALIVVDMQNAFCTRGGIFDSEGKLAESLIERIIPVNQRVIEAFRDRGLPVIYLRMGYRPDMADSGGPESPNYWKEGCLAPLREGRASQSQLTIGSWNWEIIDALKPHAGDILIDKNRYSGFPNTNLDIVLRSRNIKYLFFTGIFTNVCVESTIRDAFFTSISRFW